MANNVSPDGRETHAGTINRNGVAHISHFMLTFSAPSNVFGNFSNQIGQEFQRQKTTFKLFVS